MNRNRYASVGPRYHEGSARRAAPIVRGEEDEVQGQTLMETARQLVDSPVMAKASDGKTLLEKHIELEEAKLKERMYLFCVEEADRMEVELKETSALNDGVRNHVHDALRSLEVVWDGFRSRVGMDGEEPLADGRERERTKEDEIERMLVIPELLSDVDAMTDDILQGYELEEAYRVRAAKIGAKDHPVASFERPPSKRQSEHTFARFTQKMRDMRIQGALR
ncbi:hypothetical protein J8273_4827 [Carpediemonas membranifera]|uniref:Uncharacterized protein n=1 Tax=Carpediemonas membranifera TaxID=201153 RepID=A0A8J6B1J3_9EUKA|nr:hypothetical protein J8273_4827 [Carpediemonas membranifera]|eukprot:KAG9393708.1 hypothetical protein J8273_4827 [Carpediemonas membranifera]